MKMMATPMIEGAKSDEQILNTSAGDFACLPKNAKNVDCGEGVFGLHEQTRVGGALYENHGRAARVQL